VVKNLFLSLVIPKTYETNIREEICINGNELVLALLDFSSYKGPKSFYIYLIISKYTYSTFIYMKNYTIGKGRNFVTQVVWIAALKQLGKKNYRWRTMYTLYSTYKKTVLWILCSLCIIAPLQFNLWNLY